MNTSISNPLPTFKLMLALFLVGTSGISIYGYGKMFANLSNPPIKIEQETAQPVSKPVYSVYDDDHVKTSNLNVVKNPYGGYLVIAEKGELSYELLDQNAPSRIKQYNEMKKELNALGGK